MSIIKRWPVIITLTALSNKFGVQSQLTIIYTWLMAL